MSVEPPSQLTAIAQRVDDRLASLLDEERARWIELDPVLEEPLADLSDLVLGGGKRIRPAYCYWGWRISGGTGDDDPVIDAGCALELLHAFALAHDDVMDASPTRRGSPTVWRRFIDRHRQRSWRGEDRRFAEAAAVLVGDMAMVLADRTLRPTSNAVTAVWDELRTELNMGQYLDVVGTAHGEVSADQARIIVEYKTARYTIVRPLQLGAALAARTDLAPELEAHGLPLGTAFQLRDDVLGAFGNPAVTGKPVGDDLCEGKPTVLLARARAAADPAQREVLSRIGDSLDSATIAAIQTVIVDTGALAATEQEIDELFELAIESLEHLPDGDEERSALVALADFVVVRDA